MKIELTYDFLSCQFSLHFVGDKHLFNGITGYVPNEIEHKFTDRNEIDPAPRIMG